MAKAPKAKRYAQALFALAQEQGKEQAWLDDLAAAGDLLAGADAALFLTTPRVPAEQKLHAARELLWGKDPMVLNMVGLLLSRQSIDLLPEIKKEYQSLLDESLGRVYAAVTSAVPMSTEQQSRLRSSLSSALEKDVVLDVREDPGIIGGLTVRVGDQIIDGSVRAKLEALRQRLARESLS